MRAVLLIVSVTGLIVACGDSPGGPDSEAGTPNPPVPGVAWTAQPAPEQEPADEPNGESGQPDPADPAAGVPALPPEAVHGSYVRMLEGSTGSYFDWFTFSGPERLDVVMEQQVHWDPEASEVIGTGTGRFGVTPEGTVTFEWQADREGYSYRELHRQTLTVLAAETWRALDTGWWYPERPEVGRFWTSAGYLAQGSTGQAHRYRRESSRRFEVGDHVDGRGFVTELDLDVSPHEVEVATWCRIRVDIAVEVLVNGTPSSATEAFELDCRVEPDPESGLVRVLLVSLDGASGNAWSEHVYEMGLYERYPHAVAHQIQGAFGPVLYVDPRHPEVLFHAPRDTFASGLLEALDPPPESPSDS